MKRLTHIELLVYHSENWFAAGPDDSGTAPSYGWNVLIFADFSGVDCGWTCWEPAPNIVKQCKFENSSETMHAMDMDSAYAGAYIEPTTWSAICIAWPNFKTGNWWDATNTQARD